MRGKSFGLAKLPTIHVAEKKIMDSRVKKERQECNNQKVQSQSKQYDKYKHSLAAIDYNPDEKQTLVLQRNKHNAAIFREIDKVFIQLISEMSKMQQSKILSYMKQGKAQLPVSVYNQLHQAATIHQRANKVNRNSSLEYDRIHELDRCNCGCRRGKGDPYPFCTNQQKLKFLGPGILLLFLFKRAVLSLLLCALLIYSVFALVTNMLGAQASID